MAQGALKSAVSGTRSTKTESHFIFEHSGKYLSKVFLIYSSNHQAFVIIYEITKLRKLFQRRSITTLILLFYSIGKLTES